jgi:tetratricopeptide (TPR) repeat protein
MRQLGSQGSPSGRGDASRSTSGRGDFVSRNFKDGGSVHHKSSGGNFGSRGNFDSKGNFGSRGKFDSKDNFGSRGNFSGSRNWNHGRSDFGKFSHGNWNRNNHWWGGNNGWHGYGHRGRGGNFGFVGFYPWFGWGFGYPYLGWGLGRPYYYGGWGGYGYGYPYLNFGYGSGGSYPYYGDYGYSYPYNTYAYADDSAAIADQQPQLPPEAAATPSADPLGEVSQFVSLGEEAFQAGRYEDAIRDWQHAMVDNPNNGAVVLLMAQAMFALGQYEAAANTVQAAMQMLPESEWGNVVKNYTELYPDIQKYTDQIREAEKARDAKDDDNAVRFLLGYHFGYLNYPKQAVRELDKALDIEPQDVGAQKLRDMFALQAGIPARPPAAVPEGPADEKGQAPGAAPAAAEPPATPPQTPPADDKPADDNDVGVPAAF